jgi:hypothetical protein
VENREYDIALSFAGEDRAYVEMVAEQLRARSVKFFYDRYEQADLWGKDLYTHLIDVYRNKAVYTLMFISQHYRDKVWTNHERRAAQSRALQEVDQEYILPARFDDTEILGILPTVNYIDLRETSPVEVAILVVRKLGRNPLADKAHSAPSPKSSVLQGEVSFDYSNHNGKFRIGEGHFEFETRWSKASNTSIYCLTDSRSIRGVSLAPKGIAVNAIQDASKLDFTSRYRSPEINRIVVLQNHNGIYAALQILEISDDTRGHPKDFLRFRYWILEDGSDDFSAAGS